MKKTLSILLAFLLAATMIFSMAACGSVDDDNAADTKADKAESTADDEEDEKTPEELLVGDWETTVELGELMSEMLGESLGDDYAKYFKNMELDLVMSLELTKKGEFAMELDEDALKDELEDFKEDLKDGMEDMLRDMAKDQEADINDIVEQNGYDSLDEFLDEAVAEFEVDSMIEAFDIEDMSGEYEVEDDKLYMIADGEERDDDDYVLFEVSAKKLTIDMPDGATDEIDDEEVSGVVNYMLPLVFERK